jgi:hypothetical protein
MGPGEASRWPRTTASTVPGSWDQIPLAWRHGPPRPETSRASPRPGQGTNQAARAPGDRRPGGDGRGARPGCPAHPRAAGAQALPVPGVPAGDRGRDGARRSGTAGRAGPAPALAHVVLADARPSSPGELTQPPDHQTGGALNRRHPGEWASRQKAPSITSSCPLRTLTTSKRTGPPGPRELPSPDAPANQRAARRLTFACFKAPTASAGSPKMPEVRAFTSEKT